MTDSGAFLLLALTIIAAPYAIWRLPLVQRLVPLAVIQIGTGIVLGPSLLGVVPPDLTPALSGVGLLAVTLFAFLTGVHFDPADLKGQGRCFVAVSLSSAILPALLGAAVGWWAFDAVPGLAGPQAGRPIFAAAIAAAIAVTALPVLAAIMKETGLDGTRIGRLALGAAVVNDLLLWVMVAMLLAGLRQDGRPLTGLAVLVGGLVWLSFMVWGVKPAVLKLLHRSWGESGPRDTALVLVAGLLFGSAALSEALGLHAVIGGFVAGAILPRRVAAAIVTRFEPFAALVLMPFFFVAAGLKVDLGGLGAGLGLFLVLVTAAASLGKIVGAALPARCAGLPSADAVCLGALMQCKGLMEVVVLTILTEAGILAPAAFTAMVVMALLTTAATKPLVGLITKMAGSSPAIPQKD
ncbi:hypothetical protein A6A05_14725 [Magnetospirillum moscoviense]|uniref:Cation/H+ exchanger transmembrane domain-containing protein n=2 Tax=Magnetospirillum moscoviense TaxID=1437059 RepID=A0A178MJ97_9PROT|nr:hypothetical protein A6A05_14725 [Magnetospirillum moscoviense]